MIMEKQLPASAAIPTDLSNFTTSQLGLPNRNGTLPSTSPPLVNGTMDGPSPHVPYDAAGAPPPSAATVGREAGELPSPRFCASAPGPAFGPQATPPNRDAAGGAGHATASSPNHPH
ncbi:hypothetical protein MKX08_010412 [Trichoderma sp. CBMAI-0020]|nr:hypothetical protein MKX08_010412 [Trichoderma sp. CBMAI-0020]